MSYKYDLQTEMINSNLIDISNKTNIIDEIKDQDPGYNKVMQYALVDFKTKDGSIIQKNKKRPFIYYHSVGKIRHAISGNFTNELVGSINENNYFTVKNVSGVKSTNKSNLYKLFYNSPEEYESHFNVILDVAIKKRWHDRKMKQ